MYAAEAPTVHVVVAQDGTGDFPTVQNAVDHAGDRVTSGTYARIIIEIKPGTYHERVVVPKDRPNLTFLGSDAKATIISFRTAAKELGGTFFSAVVDVNGDGFEADNITFENTLGPGSQALAISVHSDRAVFHRCRFLGYQDTLYAASGRQYYDDCYIAGAVDFIFGNAQAVFENCEVGGKPHHRRRAAGLRLPALQADGGRRRHRCRTRAAVAPLFARGVYRLLDGAADCTSRVEQLEQAAGGEDGILRRVRIGRAGRASRRAGEVGEKADGERGETVRP